eukprot:5259734-Alexandrium_andersonii.AAC.1
MQLGRRMCNSAPPHVQQEKAAHVCPLSWWRPQGPLHKCLWNVGSTIISDWFVVTVPEASARTQ